MAVTKVALPLVHLICLHLSFTQPQTTSTFLPNLVLCIYKLSLYQTLNNTIPSCDLTS